MQEFNEIDAVTRLIEGSEDAFNELYHKYERLIYREALIRLGPIPEDAEDIVQEVFTKLWLKRSMLTPGGKIFSYIYVLMHNACLDKIEKRKTRQRKLDEIKSGLETLQPPSDKLENSELAEILHKAIEQIKNPLNRKIMKMHVVDGKNYKEIEQETGSQNQTIRNYVSQGWKFLKHYLKNQL